MLKLLIWPAGAYALAWAFTGVLWFLLEKCKWHEKSCRICSRYGDVCGCGFGRPTAEKAMAWMQYIAEDADDWNWKGVTLLITFPIAVIGLVAATHVVNPLHRRKCLADLINPPVEVEV